MNFRTIKMLRCVLSCALALGAAACAAPDEADVDQPSGADAVDMPDEAVPDNAADRPDPGALGAIWSAGSNISGCLVYVGVYTEYDEQCIGLGTNASQVCTYIWSYDKFYNQCTQTYSYSYLGVKTSCKNMPGLCP